MLGVLSFPSLPAKFSFSPRPVPLKKYNSNTWKLESHCLELNIVDILAHCFPSYSLSLFFFFFLPLYHVACGILVPRPEIEPVPPALESQSLNHWTPREVPPSYSRYFSVSSRIVFINRVDVHFNNVNSGEQ